MIQGIKRDKQHSQVMNRPQMLDVYSFVTA